MAKVRTSVTQEIDHLLDLLIANWERVPQVASVIDSWDIVDQLHFTEEWALEEDRFDRLERCVVDGSLTPEQTARYERLKRIIAKNRPILRRILES